MSRSIDGVVTGEVVIDPVSGTLAVSDRDRRRSLRRHRVTTGEDAVTRRAHRGGDADDAVIDSDVRHVVQEGEVAVLTEGQDHGVSAEYFVLTRRLGESFVIEAHLLDGQLATLKVADGREPPHGDALF